ncbi:MAG: hypothetical protein CMM44_09620 [Rhodospirillaceae bacterium]|nr:hypothetical protein [Rhodospirillaceae bacterium]|tara:strand:+ start:8068 stop:8796 length:729 start_codon:yes stop_codon:yes gene_type:complete
MPNDISAITHELKTLGFSFRSGSQIQNIVNEKFFGMKFERFSSSWETLGIDRYLADGGRYRRRRFAVFQITKNKIIRKAHQPHYQSRDFNPVNGGIQRHFLPITNMVGEHPVFLNLIELTRKIFFAASNTNNSSAKWHTEVHQFRVEANNVELGLPTPEGMHRDGVDWVCVLLIKRHNVESGVTQIIDCDNKERSEFILENPFDCVFLNDHRVHHGVTPISLVDKNSDGFRDILVVTYKEEN